MRTARVSGITRAAGRAPRYGQAGGGTTPSAGWWVACRGRAGSRATLQDPPAQPWDEAAQGRLAELGDALSDALGPRTRRRPRDRAYDTLSTAVEDTVAASPAVAVAVLSIVLGPLPTVAATESVSVTPAASVPIAQVPVSAL